jgi:hypothetical protein
MVTGQQEGQLALVLCGVLTWVDARRSRRNSVQVCARQHNRDTSDAPQRLFEEVQGFRPAGGWLLRLCMCLDRQVVQHACIAALLPAAQPHVEAEGSCARADNWGRHAMLPASCCCCMGYAGGVGGCCRTPSTLVGCAKASDSEQVFVRPLVCLGRRRLLLLLWCPGVFCDHSE